MRSKCSLSKPQSLIFARKFLMKNIRFTGEISVMFKMYVPLKCCHLIEIEIDSMLLSYNFVSNKGFKVKLEGSYTQASNYLLCVFYMYLSSILHLQPEAAQCFCLLFAKRGKGMGIKNPTQTSQLLLI